MLPPSPIQDRLARIREAGEERDAEQRATAAHMPYVNLGSSPVQVEALKLVPEERAKSLRIATFEFKKPHLAVAAYDPNAAGVAALLKEFKDQGFDVRVFMASARGLAHVWSYYQFVPKSTGKITGRVNIEKSEIERLTPLLTSLPNVQKAAAAFDFRSRSVTEFLETVFAGAMANRASDIHFESEEKSVKVRYRIDGILHDIAANLTPAFYASVVSRIKLLANLKLNVSDRPQDGRFTIGFAAKEIEIRTALAPAEFGEIIVLRILDPDAIHIALTDLGLRPDDLEIIKAELNEPNGIILNTGPTGSGKTTTLYAFLQSKYNPEIKIITIEDPIEYHVEGLEQTQVDEEAGYTFANGLRSIMRQDPDIILVGEIRDHDTAEIALQAGLTGHLVFSTIHANDAAGAIPRLIDLGVRASSIGPALNLVIAQRLVRRLCAHCRIAVYPAADELRAYEHFLSKLPDRVPKLDLKSIAIFKPKGCDACSSFGYKGRIAIFELLEVGPEMEKFIISGGGEVETRAYAASHGMVTMQQDGILKALQGMTSFSEVEEVTGKITWL